MDAEPVDVEKTMQREAAIEKEQYKFYPGKFEDIGREAKDITGTQELFEGGRVEIQRSLSQLFGVSHILSAGGQEPPNYFFGANFYSSNLALLSRVDSSGSVQGRWIAKQKTFEMRVMGQTSPEPNSSGLSLEFENKTPTGSYEVKFTTPTTYAFSCLQALNPNLSVGAETFWNYDQGFSLATYGFKYLFGNKTLSGFFNLGVINFALVQKLNERVSVVSELTAQNSQTGWEPNFTGGVKAQFSQSMARASLSSSGQVTSIFEVNLSPFEKVTVSADLNFKKKEHRFGIGFTVTA